MRMGLISWCFAAGLCIFSLDANAGSREAVDAYKRGDYATALSQCEAAAKTGDSVCQDILGLLYLEGHGVKADPVAAVRWFRLAAEQGNPIAAYNLAVAYDDGNGVGKNPAEAEKWFKVGAEKGFPPAGAEYGLHILSLHKDWKGGLKWLRPAAAAGMPKAQFALAYSYESGTGVKRNDRLALKWYAAAADLGLTVAQSKLAAIYEQGTGVDPDFKEAYFWYAVALRDPKDLRRKDDEAGQKRVAAKLKPADITEAAALARDWKPDDAPAASSTKRPRKGGTGGAPQLVATGTGFYVSRTGYVLTNNHVVAECVAMRITDGKNGIPAKIVAVDPDRDLALLQAPQGVASTAIFRSNDTPRLGENVVAVGFPLSGLLSSDAIVTNGIVSALAGMRDNRRELQISAPIQPGNSGGPLFDNMGQVIGVVVSTLDTVRLARVIGVVPENVNFAIKGGEARAFLAAHGVALDTATPGPELSIASIADQALKVTMRLECWR